MPKGRETFRKIITSPELIKQINPVNIKLMERFLKHFATKRSPLTVNQYRSNYLIFFCWVVLYADNKSFIDLKIYDFMDFFDFAVMDLKWKSARYVQMHSSLCTLSNWIERIYGEEYPNFRNIVERIEKPEKNIARTKSVFTKEELDKLMDWLGKINKPEEQCLLALIMASGARVSELVRFTTDMIDENHTAFDGLFLETTEDMKVKGRGVDGKYIPRYIIKDIFLPYYNKWLVEREKIMKETGQNHNYIFLRKNGEPAITTTIRSWMDKWDNFLEKHWYPHAGRHFWTTYLLGIGLEKELVQSLQNWCSDAMVAVYNDSTAKDRQWKSLEKLRIAMEQEIFKEELDDVYNDMNKDN